MEQDDSNPTWRSADDSDDDNDWNAAFGYDATPPGQNMQAQLDAQGEDVVDEESNVGTASFFNTESLRNFGRMFSPVLVPLPFALLIFLFTYVVSLRQHLYLQTLPLAILLLALAIMQGTMLYYAGSNEDLWLLCMIFGYSLFLLVGSFAIFGAVGAIILLILLLLIMGFLAQRGFHPVSEGYVNIVYSFGKYTRTLYSGPRFIWPWEKVIQRLSIKERLWTCPLQVVKISRDQDVHLTATLSFQLVAEDAHLAFAVEKWEESLHTLFIGTLQSLINQLSPADFVAWPQGQGSPLRSTDTNAPMDPTQDTRWDRINNALASRIQDHVAAWGIQVNWVRIQDITLIPHLAPAASPPPGMQVQARQTVAADNYAPEPKNQGVKQPAGTGNAGTQKTSPQAASSGDPDQTVVMDSNTVKQQMVHPQPQPTMPVQPQITTPNPDAESTTSPKAIKVDMLKDIYEAVRQGRITDPDTIRDLARRFEVVARDPELSQKAEFDAARAANTLYQRAKTIEEYARTRVGSNVKS